MRELEVLDHYGKWKSWSGEKVLDAVLPIEIHKALELYDKVRVDKNKIYSVERL